jgi:hypothetical protein
MPRDHAQAHTDRIIFWEHVAAFATLNLVAVWLKLSVWPAIPWDYWVPLGWGAALALHGLWAYERLGA